MLLRWPNLRNKQEVLKNFFRVELLNNFPANVKKLLAKR
jgi:hypothetical protein